MSKLLPSRNRTWGFFGEAARAAGGPVQAARVFAVVERYLVERLGRPVLEPSVARDYLDSRAGRHLGDAILVPGTSLTTVDQVALAVPRWLRDDVYAFLRTYNAAAFAETLTPGAF